MLLFSWSFFHHLLLSAVCTDKNRFLSFCCAIRSQVSQCICVYCVNYSERRKNLFIGFNFALIFHFYYADACSSANA